jgi:hypothetical protein
VRPVLPSRAEHRSPARVRRRAGASPSGRCRAPTEAHGPRPAAPRLAFREERRRTVRRARRDDPGALSLPPLRGASRRLPHRRARLAVVSRSAEARAPRYERRVPPTGLMAAFAPRSFASSGVWARPPIQPFTAFASSPETSARTSASSGPMRRLATYTMGRSSRSQWASRMTKSSVASSPATSRRFHV